MGHRRPYRASGLPSLSAGSWVWNERRRRGVAIKEAGHRVGYRHDDRVTRLQSKWLPRDGHFGFAVYDRHQGIEGRRARRLGPELHALAS